MLLASGAAVAISKIRAGQKVEATDPYQHFSAARPVVKVIRHHRWHAMAAAQIVVLARQTNAAAIADRKERRSKSSPVLAGKPSRSSLMSRGGAPSTSELLAQTRPPVPYPRDHVQLNPRRPSRQDPGRQHC